MTERRCAAAIALVALAAASSCTHTAGRLVRLPAQPQASPIRTNVGPSPASCSGVPLRAGDDVQAMIDAYPASTTFCVSSGMHRMRRAAYPKTGDAFIGAPGAILSGAIPLTGFVRNGAYWIAQGTTAEDPSPRGECAAGAGGCGYPDTVFLGAAALERSKRLPIGSGQVYVDRSHRVYLADDPAGRPVEESVAAAAFRAMRPGGDVASDDVTVRDLVVERFASPAQQAAVDARGSAGWVVEHDEVRQNHGIGICGDTGSRVVRNFVHDQGELGLCGHGSGGVYDGNEIARNNTAGFDWQWEGGGSKWVRTSGLKVTNNFSHDNAGPGLWTDTDNIDTLYANNVVQNNAGPGIFHEISYAAVIRDNVLQSNGLTVSDGLDGAGILVSASPNVTIYGNEVDGNGDGIGLKQAPRGKGAYGPYQLRNIDVHDNTITMTRGQTGLVQSVADDSYFWSRGIRFVHNTYYLGSGQRYFAWLNEPQTTAQWMRYGQDRTGTFRHA